VAAGILQIIPGFGIGRLYMGDVRTGVAQLLVAFLTFGLGGLWSLIDGIIILVNGGTDARGRRLRD
jgi:TM2 domain-containing membrane protein YozV